MHHIKFLMKTWQMSLRGQLPQLGDLGVQTVAPGQKIKIKKHMFMYNSI